MGARYLIGYKKKNNNSNKIEQGKRERGVSTETEREREESVRRQREGEESVRRQRERLQGLYTQK